MFLNIIFIYFLLLCTVLNTTFCLSKLATGLMLHWKAIFILSLLYLCFLQLLRGDVELNPGPRNTKNHLPSFCYWNLNSLPAHNFAKMLLLKAYNAMYISTILYVCLKLILVRADHPNNVTRGGVCIYYKKSLPVRVINLPDLQEALLLELNDQNKKK